MKAARFDKPEFADESDGERKLHAGMKMKTIERRTKTRNCGTKH